MPDHDEWQEAFGHQAGSSLGESGAKADSDRPTRGPSGEQATFPVVGVGASAGGLRAFEAFFGALPDAPGMAFVLVQHLDPSHESSLAELLQSHTAMPVEQVEHATAVKPGRVYVIPPGKRLTIKRGKLALGEPDRPRGPRALIDVFFRSLAEDQGERAVCVILSGTGSDGSMGLKSIKESGGVVFVQDPADAEHAGMPKSAIATGLVDLTAPAEALAQKLVKYHKSADRLQLPDGSGELLGPTSEVLQKILTQLKSQTGHDFSRYKRSTILRRIKRRMQVGQAEDMEGYLEGLRGNEEEAQALMKDFLISVTNFFRDEQAFQVLQAKAIPALFEDKDADDQVRVWVPGCATGEEAYSIAMLLCEHADTLEAAPSIQIFASDLDEDALAFARRGLYPDVIAADVSAERLERFFKQESTGYRVKSSVQELVLFAQHNVLRDPPFSKLDLISCRNLLIYLQRDVQEEVFQLFHYALRAGGFLFLGSSETADGVRDRFKTVSKKRRLYRRKAGAAKLVLPPTTESLHRDDVAPEVARASEQRSALGDLHRELMLERYAPPSVLVDEHYDIRYLFGDVGRYLRPTEGVPSHNVLQMVPRAFRMDLRTALFQVFRKGKEALQHTLSLEKGGQRQLVNLVVRSVEHGATNERMALVIFEPSEERSSSSGEEQARRSYDEEVVEQLEDELQRTKHRLETISEEYETSNEELKASNEELQSMNEELRSATEELETSKEELQSTNEELETVNHELKAKIEQLAQANSDLKNLMASTQIGTLFLDEDLRLSRYTPPATQLFNIIPADIGRPFAHVSHKIDHEDLPSRAQHVLETLETVEEEIRGRDGGHFLMRILPYRTADNRIEGVVATFLDITERKRAQEHEREGARQQAVVADLGRQALGGTSADMLMDEAVRRVAHTLDVAYCKILELQPGDDALLLKAGVGWKDGLVGSARVPAGSNSQAGYTLQAEGPVVVDDLGTERRFSGPALLTDHGVVSGMSVVIQSTTSSYGVLGAHAAEARTFTSQDANFLQAVANVLGTAIERNQVEEGLRESELRFRETFENAAVGIAHVGPDGTWLRVNDRLCEIVGYSREELSEMTFQALTHPDDLGQDLAYVRQLRLGRRDSYQMEKRYLRRDGQAVWVNLTVSTARDDDGSVRYFIGVIEDITERKQAREALQESEERYRRIVTTANEGIWLVGTEGETKLANQKMADMLQCTVEELQQRTLFDFIFEDDREEVMTSRERRIQGQQEAFEARYRRKDGSVLWAHVTTSPVTDEQGAFAGAFAMFTDITERKQAEEARRAAEAQYRDLVEGVDAIVFQADPRTWQFTFVSAQAEQLLGYPLERWYESGFWIEQVVHPEDRERVAETVRSQVARKQDHEVRYRAVCADGTVLWVRDVMRLVQDAEGEVSEIRGLMMDITALQEAMEALELLNETLEERVAERTQQVRQLATTLTMAEQRERHRVAQILHDDLQQLLYGAQMQLHLLGQVAPLPRDAAGEVVERRAAVNRIIERAIRVARTLTVDLSPPVLRNEGLVEALGWLVTQMEEIHDLKVHLQIDGSLPVAIGEVRVLLFQLVRELLFNVVKHAETREATVSLGPQDELLRIQVVDDGAGFDVDSDLELTSGNGTGFGLYSVEERLGLIGGTLEVVSTPGVGTRATILLPLDVVRHGAGQIPGDASGGD